MPTQTEIRQDITNRIVAALEQDLLPWRKPWSTSPNVGRAANFTSGNNYSGVNPLLLELHRMKFNFQSRWWGTYRQWEAKGCMVKRRPDGVKSGEWGCRIVFAKPVTKKKEKDGKQLEDKFFMLRNFTVFSADQVEGEFAESLKVQDEEPTGTVPDFAPADELIEGTGADIRHGGESAFYRPSDDYIQMPNKHRFDPIGSYYESLFHELAHWSESRLGWTASYAMNELVAEMSASFISTELGVPQGESFENHAAYIKSWLKAMNDDPSFIFKASTQASKVADYLLAFCDTAVVASV
ncbi:DNA primase TraC [Stieleria bergensis]|uniref:DNA primase TraC n=1 Tax=Stieleria bergensis TaxID=2528025 RepID=A0A517STI0_9BACT|nr:DNA primase TraC [Planctomycetes bacterium SV_7m_r]